MKRNKKASMESLQEEGSNIKISPEKRDNNFDFFNRLKIRFLSMLNTSRELYERYKLYYRLHYA